MGKKMLTIDNITGKKVFQTVVDSLENAKGKDTVAYSAKATDTITAQLDSKKANKNGDISSDFKAKSVTVSGNILPSQTGLTIGSPTSRFDSIYVDEAYLSTNTLYIGDTPIMGTEKDTIMIKSDRDQSINIKTTGVGATKVISESNVELSTSGSNADVIVQATGVGSRTVLSANNSVDMNAKYVNMTGDVTVSGPMRTRGITVDGDLIVNGETVTVNSQTIQTKDNIIEINYGQVGNGVTAGQAGIKVNRGDSAPYYMVFDESDDMFKVGMVGNLQTIASHQYVQDNKYIHPETHPATVITGLATVATSGSYSDLSNKPTSLPANGGNADTVDGKHASDFLPSTWLPANDHSRKHAITSTSDHSAGNWKMFYSNGSGQITEIGLGTSGQVLKSNGASAAPSWQSDLDTKYSAGTGIVLSGTQFSHDSSLKHIPTIETANNTRFLRNDNTWQAVTPANIGAVAPTGTIVANRIPVFSDTTGKIIKDSGFTIAKSVPSNAVFTDTNTWRPLGTGADEAAAGNHGHTSLSGLTQLIFPTAAGDSASIATTISSNDSYFDFNLSGNLSENDQWRWRFTPTNGTTYDAMRLNPTTQGKADLFVGGTKVSLDGHTHSYDNYGGFNVKANSETTGTKITANGDLVIKASGATTVSRSGNTFTISSTNTNTATAASNILAGSNNGTQVTYAPYTSQQSRLSFDTSTTNPTRTDRLNLNGYLYASKLYSNGTEVEIKGHTHSNDHVRKHAITSTSDHSAGNWKMFYSNGSGQITEMALGTSGQLLQFNGVSAAPTAVNEYELNVKTITKSLTLTQNWIDTGIEGTALDTGSYMVQISPTDSAVTNQYSEVYTGTMSWYSGSTNSTETDEIALHKAGHAPNNGHIYLRVARNSNGLLKLQIAFTANLTTATNVTFKFKRMI